MEDDEKMASRQPQTSNGPSHLSHPFLGVTICCTSIPPEQRTELASQAEQMGAKHKYDLTSDVTHLIVGDYNTPKYRYVAKARPDIKAFPPEWIQAVRQLWIEDKPIDVDALEREYTLPTFSGLHICMTGFEDQDERDEIISLVRTHGGDYHGDLTKRVTHLVTRKPDTPKYKHAKSWGLNLVSIEWLRDSIERGMILEERLYNPEWPPEERGKDAWLRQRKSPLGKRIRESTTASLEDGKRKLRRTASTKLNSQSEKIWGDIVSGCNAGLATNSEVLEPHNEDGQDAKEATALAKNPVTGPTTLPIGAGSTVDKVIFSSCRFYIHGFETSKTKILQDHLVSHEAVICASIEDLILLPCPGLYMIVPHSIRLADIPDLPETDTRVNTVTEWWVERCIWTKALIDPAEYPLGCPFPSTPLKGFEKLIICTTGFEGMLLLHISKVVVLMGAKYDDHLSKDASVLICCPAEVVRKEKLSHAKEWSIPVVSLDWLLDSIMHAQRQSFQHYNLTRNQSKRKTVTTPTIEKNAAEKDRRDDQMAPKYSEGQHMETKNDLNQVARPARASELDNTAFESDGPKSIKSEKSQPPVGKTTSSEPFNEVSPNSPRKPPSPTKSSLSKSITAAPASAIPQEEINSAITSLLAKSKTAVAVQGHDPSEPTDAAQENARRKRAQGRILGRAPSNVSTGSVDSTASSGQAVMWGSTKSAASGSSHPQQNSGRAGKAADENPTSVRTIFHEDSLTSAGGDGVGEAEDNPPPQTQMLYEDPESSEYKAKVLARITGKQVERKTVGRIATVASLDLDDPARMRKGRPVRDRGKQQGGAGVSIR